MIIFQTVFTDIDTFVVAWNEFQETISVKFGAQQFKEVLQSLLHHLSASEVMFQYCWLQCWEKVKVWWGKIRHVQSLSFVVKNYCYWHCSGVDKELLFWIQSDTEVISSNISVHLETLLKALGVELNLTLLIILSWAEFENLYS